MSDNTKYVQVQPFSLAGGGAIAGATSVILKSFQTIDGVNLAMTDFGALGFGTIEPGNGTQEEQISFTGVTQNTNGTATLTGVSHVLFVSPYTASSGTTKTHAGSTSFVISNTAGFYDRLLAKADDETITGKFVFPNDDVSNAGIATDTDTAIATAFVTLGQLSRQAISGASNASTTVKGIVQLPTQAQVDAKTATGSTSALLALTPDKQRSTLLSDGVADTGAADAYVITPSPAISAYAAYQVFTFVAAHTNTTTSTIAVNGLTTKTIKKKDGATNLIAGDIVAGQLVQIEYDGTNFQMLTPSSNTVILTSGAYPAGSGAAITGIPKKIAQSTTPVTVANTTTETALMTVAIPGGTLGTGSTVLVKMYISALASPDSYTLTLKLKYGATTVYTSGTTTINHSTVTKGYVDILLFGSGATNSQVANMAWDTTVTDSSASNAVEDFFSGTGTAAEDSTASKNLVLTVTWGTAGATDTLTMNSYVVWTLP